jgi:uncharacterized membrane protein
MESGLEFALFLVVIILLVGPVLAIAAFVRVSRLTVLVDQIPKLTARIFDLERRLAAVEQAQRPVAAPPALKPAEPPASKQPDVVWQQPDSAPPALAHPSEPAHAAIPAAPHAGGVTAPPPRSSSPPPQMFTASVHSASAPRVDSDVETMIAGHWFYYVGIVALALAAAFFLKYAFENNWIGPTGRVAIGMLIGSALFPFSQWLLVRGYKYFSEGLAGLGAAILYLSIWAGWHYYQLFGQTPAFVMMIVVTALVTAVAIARDSQRIAVLALIGGVLTPTLVSTGMNAEVVLFTYMAALAVAMMVIAWRRDWEFVPPLMFASTLFYFWGWYLEFYAADELAVTLAFGALFFVVFAALPAIESLRDGALTDTIDVILVAANAMQFLAALRQMLWPMYRWGLTCGVLALAAAHLLAERALPDKIPDANSQRQNTRMLYAGIALVFATVAIPIRLDGYWITLAWAAEGLVLVWCGLRVNMLALRVPGLLMFAIVAVRLMFLTIDVGFSPAFLLNARFLTMAFCAAAAALSFFFARRAAVEIQPPESNFFFALAIAANVCFLYASSHEMWDLLGRTSLGLDRRLAQELGLSMLWVVYSLALIVPGFALKSVALRWQGLILMGVTIVKVFLFDLSFLSSFYRIVSFFALGLVLLGVSFFYQKMSAAAGQKT